MHWKEWVSYAVKVVLLGVGFADFMGWLPPSLDLLDKVLAALILLFFWLELKPARFVVGKESKFWDVAVMVAFYVLVLDTFMALVPNLPLGVKEQVSLYSLWGGLGLIVLLAGVFASSDLKTKSVLHAGTLAISPSGKVWGWIKRFWAVRFVGCLVVLLVVSQYLFGLINQWFIVSMGKSLLLLAALFAIKDLEHSKIKAFHTLGEFDDRVLKKANEWFTSPKTIRLGVGFLLIAHALSDVGVYAVPYLAGYQPESYYLAKVGGSAHLPLTSLWGQEASHQAGLGLLYILSGLGFLVLLLLPAFLCLVFLFGKSWLEMVRNPRYAWGFGFCALCLAAFVLVPWTFPRVIHSMGVYGADFPTALLSTVMPFSVSVTIGVCVLVLLACMLLVFEQWRAYGLWGLMIGGLAFLGVFSWTYGLSSFSFYAASMKVLAGQGRVFSAALIGIFPVLDLLFYFGAFIGFCGTVFGSFVNELRGYWLDNRWVVGVSFLLVFATMFFLGRTEKFPIPALTALVALLVTLVMFHWVFFKSLIGKVEFRDDLVLALNVVVLALLLSGVFSLLVSNLIPDKILNFFVPLLLVGVGWFLSRKFKLGWGSMQWKGLICSVIAGVVFAGLFRLGGEPLPLLPSNKVLAIAAMLFVGVYEELFFRQALFKLAALSYSFFKANLLQSLLFALMHFLIIRQVWQHYQSITGMLAYFGLLFAFAWVMGMLVGKLQDKASRSFSGCIFYAILAHWVANSLLVLL